MQKITPCLWFDGNGEEAARFYVSVFPHSRIVNVTHYGEAASKASGRPKGSVMTVDFEIDGQSFLALNAAPEFSFSPAISFMVSCETQEEIDRLWQKLTDGGAEVECGWLTDKFGLSWQIVPAALGDMMKDPDADRYDQVMHALIGMKKLDLATLKQAYEQGSK